MGICQFDLPNQQPPVGGFHEKNYEILNQEPAKLKCQSIPGTMKIYTLLIATLWMMVGGCASNTPPTQVNDENISQRAEITNNDRPEGAVIDEYEYGYKLSDYLQRVSGVQVRGSGDNISVTVHGPSAMFTGSNEPIYVIDGQVVGNNYHEASELVNARDINFVRVLTGSEASIYGVRGANGVVEIVTKR